VRTIVLAQIQKGFTLVELMVTVAVLAILTTVGIPMYDSFIENNRRVTTVNELVSYIHYAHSEAVKRNRHVSLCPSTSGTGCNGSNWEDGWIVFVNNDNDFPALVDSGEEVLKVHESLDGPATLRGATDISNSITFRPKGYPLRQGELTYCDPDSPDNARGIQLRFSGRVTLTNETAAGDPLPCS